MRLKLIFILVFLLGGITLILYLRYSRFNEIKPLLNKRSEKLSGEVYFPQSEAGIRPKEKRFFLIFVSSGNFRNQKITVGQDKEIGEITILDGIAVDESKKPKNIGVIVQATFAGKNVNIFGLSLKELVRSKNLSVDVKSEMLPYQTLEKIFSKGSAWRIEFALEPLDLKDPMIDPTRDFIKMYLEFEKAGMVNYQELAGFISSGLKSNYNKPIFPFGISLQ